MGRDIVRISVRVRVSKLLGSDTINGKFTVIIRVRVNLG